MTYPVWESDFTKHTKHAYTWLEKWPSHISEDIPSMVQKFYKTHKTFVYLTRKVTYSYFRGHTQYVISQQTKKRKKTFVYVTGKRPSHIYENMPIMEQWFHKTHKNIPVHDGTRGPAIFRRRHTQYRTMILQYKQNIHVHDGKRVCVL